MAVSSAQLIIIMVKIISLTITFTKSASQAPGTDKRKLQGHRNQGGKGGGGPAQNIMEGRAPRCCEGYLVKIVI